MDFQVITQDDIRDLYVPRSVNSHKGDHGHALLVCGNRGKTGAALIAARACLRSGCGLVTVNIPSGERIAIQVAVPEAMTVAREEDAETGPYNAVGIGCGLGMEEDAEEILTAVLTRFQRPVVIDADALNIMARNHVFMRPIPSKSILTPHPKEFDRLFGEHTDTHSRRETAIKKARELGCILLLKGHETFITDGSQAYLTEFGNAGLAKGGSGDALTGILTALLAQKYPPLHAALLGTWLHGTAADLSLNQQSMESLLISDVIEHLGLAFKRILAP